MRIVEVLSRNRYGLPRENVAEEAGITPGGMLSKMPTALVERVMTLDELFG